MSIYTIAKQENGKVLVTSTKKPKFFVASDSLVGETIEGVTIRNKEGKITRRFKVSEIISIDDGTTVSNPTTPSELFTALDSVFINGGASSETTVLRWAATSETSPPLDIIQDTETLIALSEQPFMSHNASVVLFNTIDNWIDISGVSDNSWVTVRATFIGINGDADVTPSIRLFDDSSDLDTYVSIHGQSSKQKNTKTSSYIMEFFKGSANVLQIYVETDKNETLDNIALSIQVLDVV